MARAKDAASDAEVNSRNHFVLMYHHVGPLERLGGLQPFVVSPRAFCAQMDVIEARGLKVATLNEVLSVTVGVDDGCDRIVITFDDCPRELLDFAVPELERRGWKATFFAVAGKVGEYNDWDVTGGAPRVPLMGWEDLRQLSQLGHEIGAHGFSHASLRRCPYGTAMQELRTSRNTLEQQIGVSVASMAYPFGEAPDGYPVLCADAGYEGACSIFSMSRTVMADRYAIRRILVTERDQGLRMRAKLSLAYLAIRARVVDPDRLKVNLNRPNANSPDSRPSKTPGSTSHDAEE
ncbi:MAG: polysaccharide deacetylase family protein [Gemmatimonadaceae bacterium]